ncbi:MAG: DUF2007 domain-containing protein [Bryobacterales bacterium]|nr:DUF2007 domain-containing protein [Bryobacterales bacterium]
MNSQADVNLVPLTEGGLELELSEMETLSVKTLLEANGIQVMVVGASQMPNLPYEILVPQSQLQEAIQIVKDAQQGLPPESGEPA